MSINNKVKTLLNNHPRLKLLLLPFLKIVRLIRKSKVKPRLEMYEYLKNNLVQDPVLKVDEFQGCFSLSAESDLFKRLLLKREYEPELVRTCIKYLDPHRDVIDVGANIGFFSVMFAKQAESPSKVISVEPTRNALKRLYANLIRNNVDEKVSVFEGVVSNQDGKININVIEGKEEFSSVGVMGHPSIVDEEYVTESVSAITLDGLVEKFSISPGFIKVDVEGNEMNVFLGGQETLARHRPIILSELNDSLLKENGTSSMEVIELIEKFNYLVVDPVDHELKPGSKDFGDILCIPVEMGIKHL